jgi:hypothetical protein
MASHGGKNEKMAPDSDDAAFGGIAKMQIT